MPEPVNVARLKEATMDDADFMGELVEMFLADTADQLVFLEQAIASEDWTTTRKAAHRMRGACSNVGAEELSRMCEVLESQSATGAAVESSAGGEIRNEFGRVSTALQEYVALAKGEGS